MRNVYIVWTGDCFIVQLLEDGLGGIVEEQAFKSLSEESNTYVSEWLRHGSAAVGATSDR